MKRTSPSASSSFLWQGLLILLPVAVMTAVGLYSLRQDRLLADREARESGESLARQLAKTIGEGMRDELRVYRNTVFLIHAERKNSLSVSGKWVAGTDLAQVARQIEEGKRAYPELELPSMPAVEISMDRDGEFANQVLPPRPPGWLEELSPEQLQAWRNAQDAEFVSGDFETAQLALERFTATDPPRAARGNAEYLLLRLKARQLPPDKAVALFAGTKWARSPDPTEAGLPVSQLICYQALRLIPDNAGLSNAFLQTIAWAINYRPSILSSRLIEEVERVAGLPGSESAAGAEALRGWWESEEAARRILEDFRRQHSVASVTNGAYWTMSDGNDYLLSLELSGERVQHGPGSTIISNLPPVWLIHLFPEKVVAAALAHAITRADIAIPAHARAALRIGGVPYDAQDGARMSKIAFDSGPVLGEAVAHIENLPSPLGAKGIPLQVSVMLANPERLYARQKQRTVLFGCLILASAVAAIIGFLAARRAFYRQLRLSEMKSNFVSSVSHELRAPIASVRLMAEGLERGRIAGEKQRDYFKFIVQECRRLSSLIENVLDFSRIEQGRKQYEKESTDLVALTEQTVKLMETYGAEREMRIEFNLSGEPAPVDMDGKAIQQALINLIDNGIKHSPRGATVKVGLDFMMPAKVLLWVEDQGEGIPASEHEKIFERFYRVGSELRRETQGVGIGLSIVKHIVGAHSGHVIVRSAPGQGSRFTIELPVGREPK